MLVNMQTFRELLAADSESTDPYLEALLEITKTTSAEISALASDLDWQQWSPPASIAVQHDKI